MRVKLFASLRLAAGVSEVSLPVEPDTPVRAVVERLVSQHPALAGRLVDERGGLIDAVSIFADGRNVRLREGLDTRLKGEEVLALFPPIAGGADACPGAISQHFGSDEGPCSDARFHSRS